VTDGEQKIWREEGGKSVLAPAVFWRESRKANALKDLTMAEVAKHNRSASRVVPPKADSFLQQLLLSRRNDAWIIVEGRAYDVTKYVEHHPGGWLPIANLAGKDVTDAFANYHPASVFAVSTRCWNAQSYRFESNRFEGQCPLGVVHLCNLRCRSFCRTTTWATSLTTMSLTS